MAIKLEGGGGKALMAWPLVEDFFGGFPYKTYIIYLLIKSLATLHWGPAPLPQNVSCMYICLY